MSEKAKYKRVLIKLSGEMLCEPGGHGVQASAIQSILREVVPVVKAGVQVGLVVGGGNFLRGRDLADNPQIDRTTADYMGMLATIMNGLALRDSFEAAGVGCEVFSPIADDRICEPFNCHKAVEMLEAGKIVIFAGGTGSPFLTTDTCAALRACEISAEALLKATKVDGVFDSDPVKNPAAKKYDRLPYMKVLSDQLGVMDLTAVSLCMERKIPIVVLALGKKGSLAAAVRGEAVGTIVS